MWAARVANAAEFIERLPLGYETRIGETGTTQLLEGRTSFVIAHRPSTVRDADIIVVLEKGRLVEAGRMTS